MAACTLHSNSFRFVQVAKLKLLRRGRTATPWYGAQQSAAAIVPHALPAGSRCAFIFVASPSALASSRGDEGHVQSRVRLLKVREAAPCKLASSSLTMQSSYSCVLGARPSLIPVVFLRGQHSTMDGLDAGRLGCKHVGSRYSNTILCTWYYT